MTTKKKPAEIDLTPAEVLRLERASAAVSRVYEVYAGPLREVQVAESALHEAYAEVIEAHGHKLNGQRWEVVQDGDAVRLVESKETA